LLGAGIFERVDYPVEPPDPPDLVIEVESLGSSDEAIAWAVLAAAATGAAEPRPRPWWREPRSE